MLLLARSLSLPTHRLDTGRTPSSGGAARCAPGGLDGVCTVCQNTLYFKVSARCAQAPCRHRLGIEAKQASFYSGCCSPPAALAGPPHLQAGHHTPPTLPALTAPTALHPHIQPSAGPHALVRRLLPLHALQQQPHTAVKAMLPRKMQAQMRARPHKPVHGPPTAK